MNLPITKKSQKPDSNVIRVLQKIMTTDQEMLIEDLPDRLNISRESVAMAVARLLRFGFVRPSDGHLILANGFTLAGEPDADKVALLRGLGERKYVSKVTLSESLAWSNSRLQAAIGRCVADNPPLVEDHPDLIVKLDAATAFLENHEYDSGTSICQSPTEFADLHAIISKRKITVFVGAGASADAKLPTWGKLAERLGESLREKSIRKEVFDMIKKGEFIGAMSAVEHLSETKFVDDVKREFSLARCPYPSTALIVALGCITDKLETIVTTNIDGLIEANLGCGSFAELHPGVLSDAKTSGPKVIHAHGVIDRPETWIFTQKQYNKVFYGTNAYRDAMKSLFAGTTLMFVGYGMSDYEINVILDQMEGSYTNGQRPTHYFFFKATEAEARPYFIKRLEALGMRPILFSEYEHLPILVARLAMPYSQH